MDSTKNDRYNVYSIVACVRCCGNGFTDLLSSNDTVVHIHTETDGRDLLRTPFKQALDP